MTSWVFLLTFPLKMLYVIFGQSHFCPVLTLFTLPSFFIVIILYASVYSSFFIAITLYAFLYHVISNAFEMHYFRPELFPSLQVIFANLQLFSYTRCMLHLLAFSGLMCLLVQSSSTEFYAMLSLWMVSFDSLLAFSFSLLVCLVCEFFFII